MDKGKARVLPPPSKPRLANRIRKDLVIRQTKAHPGKNIVLPDGYGLRLVIAPNNRRYWQFKSKTAGKESTVQIGLYPTMGLAAARLEAQRMRELIREGRSPVAENRLRKLRNKTRSSTTFESVANELLAVKAKNCSDSYHKKISGGLRANLYPMLGALPIQDIDALLLREALRKIENRGSLDMLGNVRRWAGEVFDYAKAHGQYAGDNPADALLRNVFEKHQGERMRALDWAEIPSFMSALNAIKAAPETVCAIRLLLLTACRPGEVFGARWAEIHTLKARWDIPKERMKARRPHAVPLSKQALAVLEELRALTGKREYLFPARIGSKGATLSGMALLKAVRRVAGKDIHAHGLRATFSTHVSESLKWPDAVKEAALAHSKQGIEGAYDRATHFPERVRLMQWYADEIDAAWKGAEIIALNPPAKSNAAA
ncbi:MAG: tyrosine-type recombinase/integrase [Rhodocyclaceae bacterium]|nr:tyrosine-type recombinase/integrase [Rhodocyclaceae bacterium]